MAFAKVFYSKGFNKPFDNMIEYYKQYLFLKWYRNATTVEKIQYTMKITEKISKAGEV